MLPGDLWLIVPGVIVEIMFEWWTFVITFLRLILVGSVVKRVLSLLLCFLYLLIRDILKFNELGLIVLLKVYERCLLSFFFIKNQFLPTIETCYYAHGCFQLVLSVRPAPPTQLTHTHTHTCTKRDTLCSYCSLWLQWAYMLRFFCHDFYIFFWTMRENIQRSRKIYIGPRPYNKTQPYSVCLSFSYLLANAAVERQSMVQSRVSLGRCVSNRFLSMEKLSWSFRFSELESIDTGSFILIAFTRSKFLFLRIRLTTNS